VTAEPPDLREARPQG